MGNLRHQLINARAVSPDLAIPERILQELPGLGLFQILAPYDLHELPLALFGHEIMPLEQDVVHVVDPGDEGFDQGLLAAKLRTGMIIPFSPLAFNGKRALRIWIISKKALDFFERVFYIVSAESRTNFRKSFEMLNAKLTSGLQK